MLSCENNSSCAHKDQTKSGRSAIHEYTKKTLVHSTLKLLHTTGVLLLLVCTTLLLQVVCVPRILPIYATQFEDCQFALAFSNCATHCANYKLRNILAHFPNNIFKCAFLKLRNRVFAQFQNCARTGYCAICQ